jgi:membrane fusion protein (multidrug efflux system)
MPALYQIDLLKAQAEAKAAQIELGNTKLLADKNVVSKKNKNWQKQD